MSYVMDEAELNALIAEADQYHKLHEVKTPTSSEVEEEEHNEDGYLDCDDASPPRSPAVSDVPSDESLPSSPAAIAGKC